MYNIGVYFDRFILLLVVLSLHKLAFADCECGYSIKSPSSDEQGIYTDAFETNFLHQQNIATDSNWELQKYLRNSSPFKMSNKVENIVSNPINGRGGDLGVQLHVKPEANGVVPISEMVTKRTDMLYGSYRAAFKYTKVAGTCGGFFWYYNDTNEIDVELLSSRRSSGNTNPIWLVIHSPSPPPSQEPQVPFHPDDGYHEYRFDWTPEKVSYYADGQHIGDLTTGLPTHPGRIHFNHWSNGDNGWTAGPPTTDAVMSIAYVKAYFNTSSDDGTTQNKLTKCTDPTAPNAICEVPDLDGPLDLNQPTKFFTTGETGTEGGGAPAPAVQSGTSPSASAAQPQQSTHAPTTQTSAGQVSVDGSCGGAKAVTCLGSTFGDCCSSHSYCGSTPAYCAEGCQPAFGNCNGRRRRRLAS